MPSTTTSRIILFYLGGSVALFFIPTYHNLVLLLRQSQSQSSSSSLSSTGATTLSRQQQQQQALFEYGLPFSGQNGYVSRMPPKPKPQPPFHVLFSLLGRDDHAASSSHKTTALYDQWQVAFKSLLLNAPTDRPLHVHILCNTNAQHAVHTILQDNNILQSKWRRPIQMETYNVEALHADFRQFLQARVRSQELDERVSLGGYYRLMAHQVLNLERDEYRNSGRIGGGVNATTTSTTSHSSPPPNNIKSILYMDSDVVILSNLNDLIPYIQIERSGTKEDDNPSDNSNTPNTTDNHYSNNNNTTTTIIFQGTKHHFCSGFIILNLEGFDRLFWNLLDSIPEPIPSAGDQAIMTWVLEHYPQHVGDLPPQWQRNLGHGWRHKPHYLIGEASAAGMVHFQGGTARKSHQTYFDASSSSSNSKNNEPWVIQICQRSKNCMTNPDENLWKLQSTWGLASYYIDMPWKWALYFGKSMVEEGKEAFPLEYSAWTALLGEHGDYETRRLVPSTHLLGP